MRISKIGVELEGGWSKSPPDACIYHDGSVNVSDEMGNDGYSEDDIDDLQGEISSEPLTIDDALKWVLKNYPDYINETCGLHVHVSFNHDLDYHKIMSSKFYEFFIMRIEEWGEKNTILKNSQFWKRLSGDNAFCKCKFDADNQWEATSKREVRYRHLNYCFKLHHTVECRLLPMFRDKRLAVSAIKEICQIIEDWLKSKKAVLVFRDEVSIDKDVDRVAKIDIKEEV